MSATIALNSRLFTTDVVSELNTVLASNGTTFKTAAKVVTTIGCRWSRVSLTKVAIGLAFRLTRKATLLTSMTLPPTTTFTNFNALITVIKPNAPLAINTATIILINITGTS